MEADGENGGDEGQDAFEEVPLFSDQGHNGRSDEKKVDSSDDDGFDPLVGRLKSRDGDEGSDRKARD